MPARTLEARLLRDVRPAGRPEDDPARPLRGTAPLGRPRRVEPAGGALLVAAAADAPRLRRVARVISSDGHVIVGQALDERALVTLCENSHPHVAVLCWGDRIAEGVAGVRIVTAGMPRTRVVVVVHGQRAADARAAVSAGADGVAWEAQLELTLPVVLRSVALGQASVPRSLRSTLAPPPPALSRREHQVLGLLADGLSNAEIGDQLCLAESTVKSHLAAVFSKLGVRSRGEAVALVHSLGGWDCATPGASHAEVFDPPLEDAGEAP